MCENLKLNMVLIKYWWFWDIYFHCPPKYFKNIDYDNIIKIIY